MNKLAPPDKQTPTKPNADLALKVVALPSLSSYDTSRSAETLASNSSRSAFLLSWNWV